MACRMRGEWGRAYSWDGRYISGRFVVREGTRRGSTVLYEGGQTPCLGLGGGRKWK